MFLYRDGGETAARALVKTLPARLPGLPADALYRERDIVVFLAPNPTTFDSLAPGAPDWSQGIAFPQGNRIVLPIFRGSAGGAPMPVVLRHELAHVALRRYLGRNVPRWFHEGYAQLAAGSWTSGDAWSLRLAILAGRLPPLDSLDLEFRRERVSAEHAYLLAYTAVQQLHSLGGERGFRLLLERWRETGSLDLAIRRTYGLTQYQFERLWREAVRDQYGWLLLITQTMFFWTVLTIILLALGYLKKKRNRRKLAALKQMEPPDTDLYRAPDARSPIDWNDSDG